MLKEVIGLLVLFLLLVGCSGQNVSKVGDLKILDSKSINQQNNDMPTIVEEVPEKIEQPIEKISEVKKTDEKSVKDKDQNKNSNQPQEKPFCEGTGPVRFTFSPMKVEDLDYIDPMGMMIGGHVTPIDHQYYYAKSWTPKPATLEELKEVRVPAAGVVRDVQRMPTEFKTSDIGDYRIIIDHSCTFYTIYIHLNLLSPKLQAMVGNRGRTAVKVDAGEMIGKARSFDFSTHNEEVTLNGFVVPQHYEGESWKIHTVDPFDYFAEPLKTSLLEKDLRTALPRGGKIDYDIDGKLIGNWFKVGSGGYSGKVQGEYGYWKNHLAFAPDALDTSYFIASLGYFEGEAKQFGIKGNALDPASVDVKSGLLKLELAAYNYVDSAGKSIEGGKFKPGVKGKVEDKVEGVLLVELVDARTLKAEVFPGKSKVQVMGFVNPTIYER